MTDPIHIGAPDGSVVEFPAGTPDDTIKTAMAKAYPSPAAAAANTAEDVAKSAGIGVVKGGIGLVGAPSDLSGLVARANKTVSDYFAKKLGFEAGPDLPEGGQLGSANIQKAVESQTGEFYHPKTTAGEYAQTAGEFVPALVGGPEGIVSKVLTRVAVPAVASETAGQLTKGTAAEPYARVAAGLVAPVAAGAGLRQVTNAVTGQVEGMSRGAGRHLLNAVEADGPAAVQARVAELGPDAMLADAGPALLGKAQGASLNSDEGRSVLQSALKTRDTATNARIQTDIEKALGPYQGGDPQLVSDAILAHRKALDSVNYPAALDAAPQMKIAPLMTELIDRIHQTPVGSMENKALTNLQKMLTKTEKRPVLDVNGDQVYDRLGHEKWQDVPVSHDDASVLHKVKQELDNVIEYDAPGLGVPAGALKNQQATLKQMRGAVNDALEEQVPGYADANAVSSALAKRGEAVKAGTQYLGNGKTTPSPERFAADFEPLTQGEKIAFGKGSRGEVERIVGTKANDLQALRNDLQGEGGWNTAKIATVHGQPAADELAASVDRNLKFRDTHNKVVENSQTAQRNAAAKEMKPDPSSETPFINPNANFAGMAATGAKKAVNLILNQLRPDPTRHYGEVARILSEQGPARDARQAAVIDALDRRQRSVTNGGSRAVDAVTAALLARQGSEEPGARVRRDR